MIERSQVIDKCIGCNKIQPDNFCSAYLYPISKWKIGNCPLASHLSKDIRANKFIDPLKSSKKQFKRI